MNLPLTGISFTGTKDFPSCDDNRKGSEKRLLQGARSAETKRPPRHIREYIQSRDRTSRSLQLKEQLDDVVPKVLLLHGESVS